MLNYMWVSIIEKFLSKKIIVLTIVGDAYGMSKSYKGIVTSFDDEFICLDEKIYIARKYIASIIIK